MTVEFARDLVLDLYGIEAVQTVSFNVIDGNWVAVFKIVGDDLYYKVGHSSGSNEIVLRRFEQTDYRICLKPDRQNGRSTNHD